MKRRILLLIMTALLSVGAWAENLWTSDTEGGTEVDNYGFSIHPTGLTAGDIISFTINTATGQWGNVLTLKTVGVGTNGQWTYDVPGDTDLASAPVSAGTVVSIVVTDAIVTAAEDKGLWIGGYTFTVTSIDHEKAAGVKLYTNNAAENMNYWSTNLSSSILKYAKTGDVLHVTISAVGDNEDWRKLFLQDAEGNANDNSYTGNILYTCANRNLKVGTIDIRLTDAMVSKAQAGSLYIGGFDFTFTAVDLYLTSPTVNISSAGYATFGYPVALDLTDVDAYTVSVSGTTATLTSVKDMKIPANTGIILKGSNGDEISLPLTTASTNEIGTNNLHVSDGTVTGDGTIYVLANGGNGVGFYKLASGVKIPAGKAYLQISGGEVQAPAFFGFGFGNGDGTTGIQTIDNGKLTNDNVYYDLQGRRVAQPTKGLYIVNGKKVVIK